MNWIAHIVLSEPISGVDEIQVPAIQSCIHDWVRFGISIQRETSALLTIEGE